MLRSLKDLESYKVIALDGDIGRVNDFLFDDQHWTTRYLVTDTGGFSKGKEPVLISPISFRSADWTARLFQLDLTQDKVRNSPSVDLHEPVSRQYEQDYSQYYSWPAYWECGGVWGGGDSPYPLAGSSMKTEPTRTGETSNDFQLRSVKEVIGYHVHGKDGEIGHIADFIVNDETWTIHYLVIDTSNWWFSKKVLVTPYWAQRVSWSESMVYLDLTRDAIKNSPAWNPEALVSREYEERLHDHYGRKTYFVRGDAKAKLSAQPAEAELRTTRSPG